MCKYLNNTLYNVRILYSFMLLLVIGFSLLTACDSTEEDFTPPTVDSSTFLKDYQKLGDFPLEAVRQAVQLADYGAYQDQVRYGVTVYTISYYTQFQGERILASGLVCLPDVTTDSTSLLLGFHGTITAHREAPSNFNLLQENISGFELFASLGFVSIIPDYIGFGASENVMHPYYHYASAGAPSMDMVYAAEELLIKLNAAYQKELFMIGYSQGGYMSLATARYFEENLADTADLTLRGVAAGAGAYHIAGVMEQIIRNNVYPSPAYLAYVIYAYHQTYGWDDPLTDYFQAPYAAMIPGLFDGSQSQGDINRQLTQNMSELLNPVFLASLRDGSNTRFLNALEENRVDNWAPRTAVRLYHDQNDEIVPIADSEETYETMQGLGAQDVAYFPYDEGGSHSEGIQPMLNRAAPWFISLLNN